MPSFWTALFQTFILMKSCSNVPTSERDRLWSPLYPIHCSPAVVLLSSCSTPVIRKKVGFEMTGMLSSSLLGFNTQPRAGPEHSPSGDLLTGRMKVLFNFIKRKKIRHRACDQVKHCWYCPQLSGEWPAKRPRVKAFEVSKAGFNSIFLLWNPFQKIKSTLMWFYLWIQYS